MGRELCRNFQSGSCRYGERCRFLHPQEVKPNSPFGFGTQTRDQLQKSSNPYGFGVQGGGSSRPNQFQPFDNKWSRTASTSGGGGNATQQTGKTTQQADHKCTDPSECKRLMEEDYKNERPMWKLTSYGHFRYLPCDIIGDICYEELRAMAYDEAKRGIPVQSIVERERNLQNSKIAEFDNLLRNPYRGPVTVNQSPLAVTNPSIFPPTGQINPSPASAFSGFNQQTAFPNTNPGVISSSAPPPNPFDRFNQKPNAFSVNTPQPVPSGPSGFQTNTSTIAFKPASFGPGPGLATTPQNNNLFSSLNPMPAPGLNPSTITFKPASFGPGPGLATTPQNNNLFSSLNPTPAPNTSQNNQTGFNFNVPVSSFTSPVMNTTSTSSGTELRKEATVDTSIWLKEKWIPGEIPEQPPPDELIF